MEHHEISGYGTVRAYAQALGEKDAVPLLTQSLEEEKAADKKLTQVGMTIAHPEAMPDRSNAKAVTERA